MERTASIFNRFHVLHQSYIEIEYIFSFEGITPSMMNFGGPSISHGYGQSNSTNQFQSNIRYQSHDSSPGLYGNNQVSMTPNQQPYSAGLSNTNQQSNSLGILMPNSANSSYDNSSDLLL